MRSLKIIQTLFKVLKILCLIGFICCIVGASICASVLILLPILKNTVIYDGKTLAVLLADKSATLSAAMTGAAFGLVECGVGIFLTKHTEKFCDKELAEGTPFKKKIVKDMRMLAFVHIIASFAVGIALSIAYVIVKKTINDPIDFDYSNGGSLGFGIALLVISLFADYGAEKDEGMEEPKTKSLEAKEE